MTSIQSICRLSTVYHTLATGPATPLQEIQSLLFKGDSTPSDYDKLFRRIWKDLGRPETSDPIQFGKESFLGTHLHHKVRLQALKHILDKNTHLYLSTILEALQNGDSTKAYEYLAALASFDPTTRQKIQDVEASLDLSSAVEQVFISQALDAWVLKRSPRERRAAARSAIEVYLNNNTMTELDLSFLKIKTLPDIFNTPKSKRLLSLNLAYNEFTSYPKGIQSLTQLQNLNLACYGFHAIPEDIYAFTQLRTLDLSDNDFTSLPEGIQALTQLQTLNLRSNELLSFPKGIIALPNLKMLDLGDTPLTRSFILRENWLSFLKNTHLLDVIKALQAFNYHQAQRCLSAIEIFAPTTILKIQDLYPSLRISSLVPGGKPLLKSITQVFVFQLLESWIAEESEGENRSEAAELIASFITDDKETRLNLGDLGLKMLPDIFGLPFFSRLTSLDLPRNHLTSFPRSLKNLTNLENLDFCINRISVFPEVITTMIHLKKLTLYGNQISSIPGNISNLTKLQQLDFDDNRLETLPDSMGYLTNLMRLSVEKNQLIHIPHWIDSLPRLQRLFLNENPLTTIFKFRQNWALFLHSEPAVFLYDSSTTSFPNFQALKNNPRNFDIITTWLNALKTQMCNYTREESRQQLKNTTRYFLEKAEKNEIFRGLFLSIIEEACSTCVDGLTLSILHLKIAELQLSIDGADLQTTYTTLTKLSIFNILEKIAKEKIQTLKDVADINIAEGLPRTPDQLEYGNHIHVIRVEREIILIYPIRLKASFDLPIDLTEMLFETLTQVEDEDIELAKMQVEETLSNPLKLHQLLIENPLWLETLRINNPIHYEAIESKVALILEADPLTAATKRTELFTLFSKESVETPAASAKPSLKRHRADSTL